MDEFLNNLKIKYPTVDVDAYENKFRIELMNLKVAPEHQGQGIGSKVIQELQHYARSQGKPIVLRPEAERGRKKDLERFYKGLGFVDNKGRNIDYSLSSPVAKTMYWRFKEWVEFVLD
jgi:GNAT superfamily N-acetyltransferase